ncbi:MAG: isoprenylcysteine carboxylmethyltransferase family protein [Bryobacteraceae bacterium]|nr:isoprenylcysteine carboxylmethyltransferase family protein [Bryobacteraceae bacterium]
MMRRYWFPKRYADSVARLRVAAGFLLAFLFAWFARPTLTSLAAGAGVAALGMAVRAWAAGHLAKNEQLATTGPYAYVRNPLYLGTLIAAAGFVVASRRPALAVAFGAVFTLVYLPVIEQEEQHLRKLFPAYAGYASRVPLLWPRLRGSPGGRFRPELYRRNREYEALLGFLAGIAILTWKAL